MSISDWGAHNCCSLVLNVFNYYDDHLITTLNMNNAKTPKNNNLQYTVDVQPKYKIPSSENVLSATYLAKTQLVLSNWNETF